MDVDGEVEEWMRWRGGGVDEVEGWRGGCG